MALVIWNSEIVAGRQMFLLLSRGLQRGLNNGTFNRSRLCFLYREFGTLISDSSLRNNQKLVAGIRQNCPCVSSYVSSRRIQTKAEESTEEKQTQDSSKGEINKSGRKQNIPKWRIYNPDNEGPSRPPIDPVYGIWDGKILYSTHLEKFHRPRSCGWEMYQKATRVVRTASERLQKYDQNIPMALEYLQGLGGYEQIDEQALVNQEVEKFVESGGNMEKTSQFPYQIHTPVTFTNESDDDSKFSDVDRTSTRPRSVNEPEFLTESNETGDVTREETFGNPDPTIPASTIPCGGCGALLHCQNQSIPGYMHSQRFVDKTDSELKADICNRCHLLKTHQAALNVNVSPDMYPKIISKIQDERAMVLLLVDLLDFPCSIWPGIVDIIGPKRPVFLVGNKVDLLPPDQQVYLDNIRYSLQKTAEEVGLNRCKIISTCLISARTGFGVERMISDIHRLWGSKGHIFILGCTNAGKSSLFNRFLRSDLCKTDVGYLIQHATVSQWPGTTLNLLKFPILRPSYWRVGERTTRVSAQEYGDLMQKVEKSNMFSKTGDVDLITPVGSLGQTFKPRHIEEAMNKPEKALDMFHVNPNSRAAVDEQPAVGDWDPDNHFWRHSKWCYDTPGTISDNQVLDLFTLPELMVILPKAMILPRTYFIKVGMTLFLGGIARLDYLSGYNPIRFTVFSSDALPVTIVNTVDAEFIYKKALGTAVFSVPRGDEGRMAKFPPLKSRDFQLCGVSHKSSCADIVLSSTGWVAVSVGKDQEVNLKVHTPNGTGMYCRQPSLLPETVTLKGKRIRDTPAYGTHKIYSRNYNPYF